MQVNFITVKWGDKYGAEYVNRIHTMISKYYNKPFNFYCYTDDPTDVNATVIPIKNDLEIYWNKLALFNLDLPGLNVFFDLDVVIQNDLGPMIDLAQPGKLTVVKAYWKDGLQTDGKISQSNGRWNMDINTSIMMWHNDMQSIWNHFDSDPEWYMLDYEGVCRYIFYQHKDLVNVLPKGMVYSRLAGITENKEQDIKSYGSILENQTFSDKLPWPFLNVYTYDDAIMCLFNGPTSPWLYEGYEKHWM